jgi:hypothetical protein
MQMRHLLTAAAVGLLLSTSVYAHDDAHWIEHNPSYVGENGKHCCGPSDCRRLGKEHFRHDDDAIYYLPTMQKFTLNGPGVYRSETAEWWACTHGGVGTGEKLPPPSVSCIFVPFHSQ